MVPIYSLLLEKIMAPWRIAAVQMDCRLGDRGGNLECIKGRIRETAARGARLIIFPECALTGYCFTSKEEARPHAEPVPGPSTLALAEECRRLGVWVIVGLLEGRGTDLFNACALIGPKGLAARYRKIHLPFLGIDRFTTPGDEPFAVHDLGGLRVGMSICYDASFPEAARCLMIEGADLIALPTNWPPGAAATAKYLIPARALENRVFVAAVNRVGTERGFTFIGQSKIIDVTGDCLACADSDQPAIMYAVIDPDRARDKHIVNIPGEHEIHRTNDRRPELYGAIVRAKSRGE
jgi:predicted amidohydrolase